MLVKYDNCDDNTIINIPDSLIWRICFRHFDENGVCKGELCLIIGDETIVIRDFNDLCDGRPNLPIYAVRNLYEDIVNVISDKIESEPDLRMIDITSIESKLLNEKYEKIWIKEGYIVVDPVHGYW